MAIVVSTALRADSVEPVVPSSGVFGYSHCRSVDDWQDHWKLLTVIRHIGPAEEDVISIEDVAVEIPDNAALESVEVRVFEGTPFMTVVAEDDSESERTSVVQGMPSPLVEWNSLPADIEVGVEYTVAVVSEFPASGELNPEEPLFRATSITFRDRDDKKQSHIVDVEQWISRAPFESEEFCTPWQS